MSPPPENGGRFKQACLAIFTNGHVIIALTSLLTIVGTAGGLYATMRSSIAENSRAQADANVSVQREVDDLRREIDKLHEDMRERTRVLENWERDEKVYDAEIRARTDAMDTKFAARIDLVDSRLTAFLNSISERLANFVSTESARRSDFYAVPSPRYPK